MVPLLEAPSKNVRLAAMMVLEHISNSREAQPPLAALERAFEQAVEAEDVYLAGAAARTLGHLGGPECGRAVRRKRVKGV